MHSYRSVLEVLLVSHACRRRPMVIDLISTSTATFCILECVQNTVPSVFVRKHVQKTTPSFLVSVRIAPSVSIALTMTMLTWNKLSKVHTYLGLEEGPKIGAAMAATVAPMAPALDISFPHHIPTSVPSLPWTFSYPLSCPHNSPETPPNQEHFHGIFMFRKKSCLSKALARKYLDFEMPGRNLAMFST